MRCNSAVERYVPSHNNGMVGWGQRLMKLDQIDPSLAGQGVRIGIVDSGCDNSHPQLSHVTRGIDLTNNRDNASWTKDTMSHGTHCAGIITGASTQLKGVRGFAPMAEVHALKVFPGGRFSDLIDALDQCIERQLDIVNLSLGSSETSELVAHKLAEVRQHGVACIVAAGNASGPVQFPGTEPSVLTVAALGKLDEFPPDTYHAQTVAQGLVAGTMFSPKFTCFGPQIAVAAPGVAIVSTVPGGGYAAWDGTSMATPLNLGLCVAHHRCCGRPRTRNGARRTAVQDACELGVRYLGVRRAKALDCRTAADRRVGRRTAPGRRDATGQRAATRVVVPRCAAVQQSGLRHSFQRRDPRAGGLHRSGPSGSSASIGSASEARQLRAAGLLKSGPAEVGRRLAAGRNLAGDGNRCRFSQRARMQWAA